MYYSATGQGRKPESGGNGESGDGSSSGSGSGAPQTSCGSAAGGPTQEHETGDADRPGPGAYDPDAVRREAAEGVMSGGPGTGEGTELRQWAESELGIDRAAWHTALASVIGGAAAPYGAPTRWRWPGRRDMSDMGGAMVPRWVGERPSIAVIIDTSSSITPTDLDMARTAGAFVGRLAEATYYGCSIRATLYGRSMPDYISGNGGTDMAAGIATAIADGAKAVIVITDCETDWSLAEDTGIPVIIAANYAGSRHIANRDYWYPPEWMTVVPLVQS